METVITILKQTGLEHFAIMTLLFAVLAGFCYALSFGTREMYLKQRARAVAGALFSLVLGCSSIIGTAALVALSVQHDSGALLIGAAVSGALLLALATIMLVHHVSRFN